MLINIKEYVKELKQKFCTKVTAMGETPSLIIIQVGNNEASNRYVKNKVKDCAEVGIDAQIYYYPETIGTAELTDEIKSLQEFADGVIVQLPLPPHINPEAVLQAIDPSKDVDGFRADSKFVPATPKGIMDYLAASGFNVDGKLVVIIGRSEIVGKPLAKLMTDANATVTLCHSHTSEEDMGILLTVADLVVCAVGKAEFLDCYRTTAPIIDVGINFNESGKLVGDCYNTEGRDVTPVPGGVGLLTRCALLENVIAAAEK